MIIFINIIILYFLEKIRKIKEKYLKTLTNQKCQVIPKNIVERNMYIYQSYMKGQNDLMI